MPIIDLQDVSKTYASGDVEVHALRGVSLRIERGEFAAVAGPSGSGKSTLLNIISGLDRPTAGRVFVDGEETTQMSSAQLSRMRLRKMGFVFQSYNLIPVLTAYENAEYVLMLQGVAARDRRARVMAVLDQVGLAELAARFPRELSGGQQQRVAVARAIAARPSLVLADEPTANLDSKTATSLIELMEDLNHNHGVTFLFSSHDQRVLDRAHRLIELTDGRITRDVKTEAAA